MPANFQEACGSIDLDCSVCLQILCDPVAAPCGHDFCKACCLKWCRAAAHGIPLCPICRAPLPPNLGICVRLKRLVEQLDPVASKRRRQEQDSREHEAEPQCNSSAANGCSSQSLWMFQSMHLEWGMAVAMTQYGRPGAFGTQPAAVTGTPVAEYVEQQHLTLSSVLPRNQEISAASNASALSVAPATAAEQAVVAQHNSACRWQSVADIPARLACAREILAVFGARSSVVAADGAGPKPATLAAVRAVEVALYRSARSRDEYLDRRTLSRRVTDYIRRRAAALAASTVRTAPSNLVQPTVRGAAAHESTGT